MKAFVCSIGESTADLCIWSLTRLGFEVELILNNKSLGSKLKQIFENTNQDFVRVDADVVVNKNVLELVKQKDLLWYQGLTYDWYKQDTTHGGVQFVREDAIELVRPYLNQALRVDRAETYLTRVKTLHNPRTFGTFEKICGLHGYKQSDVKRVKKTKINRNQQDNYDWELAERLDAVS